MKDFSYTLNKELLENILESMLIEESHYTIGVDTYDKNCLVYCLVRKVGKAIEVLLCKKMRNRTKFEKEVKNLAKYFNADIFKEDNERRTSI